MFSEEIDKLKSNGLYRSLKYFDSANGPWASINGKEVLMFSSNSYLGLLNDKRLKEAAKCAIDEFGIGTGGSRLTTGSYSLHKKLEYELTEFKNTDDTLLLSSGYLANVGVISAIANNKWMIFCDRLNHASIIDGCKLSGAKLVVYKHCDIIDLEKKIKKYGTNNNIIITDGVFSMDGDIAPLPDIVGLASKYNCILMVDDAHGTGVLGKNGTGTFEYYGIKSENHIQVGTLSKAFSSEGGFVTGNSVIIDYLRNKARTFIYSTSLAPVNLAVSIEVLKIIKSDNSLINNLINNAIFIKKELKTRGFNTNSDITPIVPIIIGEAPKTIEFSNQLFEDGFYVSGIRPPTVPKGTSRLRVSLMATHCKKSLTKLIESIVKIGKGLNII